MRKRHLCWGVSERFYRVILPTFVLFPDDAEFPCFPVYKLVRFYVNSNKKPNTSMSFIVAFSSIFHDNFNLLFLFSVWKAVDILFRAV